MHSDTTRENLHPEAGQFALQNLKWIQELEALDSSKTRGACDSETGRVLKSV